MPFQRSSTIAKAHLPSFSDTGKSILQILNLPFALLYQAEHGHTT